VTKLDEKQQSGVAFIGGVMGDKFGEQFRQACEGDAFGSPITRNAASACFHEAWQHPGLTRKEKSIAIIGMMIALRLPAELKNHVKVGLANGLTVAELEGILVQVAPYVGFPCVAPSITAVVEAMREAGVSPEGLKTAEERGLL